MKFLIRAINKWRGITSKPKPVPALVPALKIWYQYHSEDIIRQFTYSGHAGKSIWAHQTTRRFLRWYYGREDSTRVFIQGSKQLTEWRRAHILCIETFVDERDAEEKKRR